MNLRWLFPRKEQEDLLNLEAQLDSAFRPVGPRPEFVRRLRFELLPPARRGLLGIANGGWQAVMLIGAALFSALLLFQNGMRLVVTLLGALGLVQQARKSAGGQGRVPIKPSR